MEQWRKNLMTSWLAQIITITGFGFVLPFLPYYIQELGVTEPGALRRWVGIIALFLALAGAVSLPIFLTRDLWSYSALFVLASFFFSGVEPILQSYMSTHTPPHRRGIVFGIQTLVGSFGWFVSPLTGSWIAIQFSTRHVFLSYSLAIILAFGIVITVKTIAAKRPGAGAT